MPRTPYAGRVLVEEVHTVNPDAEVEWSGEADGLGVDRAVYFDTETSRWLRPALDLLGDKRVSLSMEGDLLEVTFSDRSTLADDRSPFYVKELKNMLGDELAFPVSEPEDERTEPTPEPTEDDQPEDSAAE